MSPGVLVIVNLFGGIAMLLWGVRMVRTGIMRAWGDRLKRFIEQNLTNRLTAFTAGMVATFFLQSGTATAVIITSLAASGVIAGAAGLAVLLGADLGSAVVTGVFAIAGPQITGVSPVLLFVGYVLFATTQDFRYRNFGRILMGLGLVLLALSLIVAATQPLREASLFHQVLQSVGAEPLLALILGALITWMSYSTLSMVLLIVSFVTNGSLDLAAAMAFVLGINLGGGLPALTATADQPREARRMPLANLVARGVFALIAVAAFKPLSAFVAEWPLTDALRVVAWHITFNGVMAIAALPLAGFAMAAVTRLLPVARVEADALLEPRYLDRSAFETPQVALSNAQQETVRMTELLDRMFATAVASLASKKIEPLKEVKLLDDRLNGYQDAIHAYLVELTQEEMSAEASRQALEIMLYVSNLEHAGDILQLNLADRLKAKVKQSIEFSKSQSAALEDLTGIVRESIRLACGVLTSGDVAGARKLIEQKGAFRALENRLIDEHFADRARLGPKSLRTSALFVDIIRDLHALNSHVVSAAYPIMDRAGLLRQTRLRTKSKGE